MRRGISLLGLVAVSLLAACGGNSSTTATATGPKTVKIAITGPFTGDASPIGLGALHGAQMAVDEWNAKSGINGTQIQVDVGDDAGKGDQGVTLANKYVADPDILGVIGPMFSGIALAELPLFERATLPMITESGSNPKITESGWKTAHRLGAPVLAWTVNDAATVKRVTAAGVDGIVSDDPEMALATLLAL